MQGVFRAGRLKPAQKSALSTAIHNGMACGGFQSVNFVGRAVKNSLDLYLDACTPREKSPAPQNGWFPLREACVGTPYSQEYVSLLARLGRIEATKREETGTPADWQFRNIKTRFNYAVAAHIPRNGTTEIIIWHSPRARRLYPDGAAHNSDGVCTHPS